MKKTSGTVPTFLKWAGGKQRLLDSLTPLFPDAIKSYYEPFLGGGSVFFYVAKNLKPRRCVISDTNRDLVATYIDVRDSVEALIKELEHLKKRDSEAFYYNIRAAYNEGLLTGLKRSAAFIYMNKTCYAGLFRVNSKNKFNVPYGRYKNPKIYEVDTLKEASSLLQGVEIRHCDYREIASELERGDFIYLDPCYDPINKTSFVQYTPERFSSEDREHLSDFVNHAMRKHANVLLSNNDIKSLRKTYKELYPGFNFHRIVAPRSLGSRVGADTKIVELAISNY